MGKGSGCHEVLWKMGTHQRETRRPGTLGKLRRSRVATWYPSVIAVAAIWHRALPGAPCAALLCALREGARRPDRRGDVNRRKDAFDEGFPLNSLRARCGAANAVEKLRRADRGERHWLFTEGRELGSEVQPAAFRGNQDARIDQRPQRDLGTLACLRVTFSTASR